MSVISTDQWLDAYVTNKKESMESNIKLQRDLLCKKLEHYYLSANSHEIHSHLVQHGFFLPSLLDKPIIESMSKKKIWTIVEEEWKQLRMEWKGPNIPIFIFPSNIRNKQIRNDFNGIAGLAHRDKVFLFVTGHTTSTELKALITHEYNHVCRLEYLNQNEDKINLLDSLIIEGLAEMAVNERLGKECLAKWTSEYSLKAALKNWEKWIKPNLETKKSDSLHNQLLYGKGPYPSWVGYNVGFHLVSSYVANTQAKVSELLRQPAKKILEASAFM